MIVCVLVMTLTPSCFGLTEIVYDRAEQYPGTHVDGNGRVFSAHNAIDNDITSSSTPTATDPSWLRIYFRSNITVQNVLILKWKTYDHISLDTCYFEVSVYKGEVKRKVCRVFTKTPPGEYLDQAVQCEGVRGDRVEILKTGCANYLMIFEMKIFCWGKSSHYIVKVRWHLLANIRSNQNCVETSSVSSATNFCSRVAKWMKLRYL